MRIDLTVIGVLVTAALAVPPGAHAELYKWVDERGVINYSNTRPDGVKKVTQLTEDSSTVTVVPGMSKEQIARLEQELYEAQRARDAMGYAGPGYASYYPGYASYYPGAAAYRGYFPGYRYPIVGVRAFHPQRFHVAARPMPGRGARR